MLILAVRLFEFELLSSGEEIFKAILILLCCWVRLNWVMDSFLIIPIYTLGLS